MIEVDPLVYAYVAKGAFSVLAEISKTPRQHTQLMDKYGGELGFIDAVLGHVPPLEERAVAFLDKFTDVYVYDVAEPFGETVATQLALLGYVVDPNGLIEDLLKEACR